MDATVFKEGQIYVCTKSNEEFWTVGKEYKVVLTEYGTPIIVAEDGETWFVPHFSDSRTQFELKDPTIDLKTEIIYWKETADYWKNQCKEFDYKLNNQIKYNIYLEKELNKNT